MKLDRDFTEREIKLLITTCYVYMLFSNNADLVLEAKELQAYFLSLINDLKKEG